MAAHADRRPRNRGRLEKHQQRESEEGVQRSGNGEANGAKKRPRDGARKIHGRRRSKQQQEEEEVQRLEEWISWGAPPRGSNPLAADLGSSEQQEKEDGQRGCSQRTLKRRKVEKGWHEGAAGENDFPPYVGCKKFADMPLSERTQRALREARFVTMTAIQRAALPHALCGRDILGAAKTGSGKTLAFLVPLLERLHRSRWSQLDGVGAIIISPTRELATQIFGELNKIGRHHGFSGALLIGGRAGVDGEKERVASLNILVATPGRLLQHMDETPNFDCSNLQVLVLDEADRILDLGFTSALNAILANLPSHGRQTLLFSATQTKSVKDLARLSLCDPEYLAVHAEAKAATPARLMQTVMGVRLDRKMDVLWSFLKTHSQCKVIVFLSSCKQVKFVYEAFRRLRPGVPLKVLHGRMKQMPRLAVFYDFCDSTHAVLFATDVAARGLDFPAVDWVVQMDCPDDVATYIHRVGRTARYNAAGQSLLLLTPSEKAMLGLLEEAKIPFRLTNANPAKVQHITPALASLLSKDPDLKYLAQRAFVTYLRSIHVQSNKEVFDVTKLPIEEYSASLGLPTAPKVRFLKKSQNAKKNIPHGTKEHPTVQEPHGVKEAEGALKGGAALIGGEGARKVGESGGVGKRIVFDEEEEGEEVSEEQEEEQGEGQEAGKAGGEEEEGWGEKETRREGVKDKERGVVEEDKGEEEEEGGEEEEEREEDGDGFLRVKAFTDEDGVTTLTTRDAAEAKARPLKMSRKQMKKLKARPGKMGGTRLVFDDEGHALPPLAALAKKEGGLENCAVSPVLLDVEERYAQLRAELKAKDVEDKELQRQRLREKRQKEKRKGQKRGSGEGEGAQGRGTGEADGGDTYLGASECMESGDDGGSQGLQGMSYDPASDGHGHEEAANSAGKKRAARKAPLESLGPGPGLEDLVLQLLHKNGS